MSKLSKGGRLVDRLLGLGLAAAALFLGGHTTPVSTQSNQPIATTTPMQPTKIDLERAVEIENLRQLAKSSMMAGPSLHNNSDFIRLQLKLTRIFYHERLHIEMLYMPSFEKMEPISFEKAEKALKILTNERFEFNDSIVWEQIEKLFDEVELMHAAQVAAETEQDDKQS